MKEAADVLAECLRAEPYCLQFTEAANVRSRAAALDRRLFIRMSIRRPASKDATVRSYKVANRNSVDARLLIRGFLEDLVGGRRPVRRSPARHE